jgi:hypothetical protein
VREVVLVGETSSTSTSKYMLRTGVADTTTCFPNRDNNSESTPQKSNTKIGLACTDNDSCITLSFVISTLEISLSVETTCISGKNFERKNAEDRKN